MFMVQVPINTIKKYAFNFLNQLNNKKFSKRKLSRYRDFIYIDDVISIIIKCMKIQNKI